MRSIRKQLTSPHLYSGALYRGMRIGILGGTFDPAHQGHLDISLFALKQFRLHQVWWLVTPQNPLKKNTARDMQSRLQKAAELASHPRIIVTSLEDRLKTRFTVDTVQNLQQRYPSTDFVFLMGSDNWAQLRRWKNWRRLAENISFAVFERPPHPVKDLLSPTAQILRRYRKNMLFSSSLPCWTLGKMKQNPLSSTQIRRVSHSA